jgi:pantoate--beta-alanine ligase
MQIVHALADLNAARQRLGPCALVPTMGNLHAGHLSLVARGREAGLPVVASIFVNRLQFAPSDDFERYPRTLDDDCALLDAAGCELVFAPAEDEMYPQPQRFKVHPDPALADILEGHFRPGFFVGVCTLVMKLFCCVQPRLAVFGKKDYQQWLVIRRMVEQFAMPIEVVAGETLRDPAGLALSSRNAYLDPAQRSQAPALSRALRGLVDEFTRNSGEPAGLAELESGAMARLVQAGWTPDYLAIRRRRDLQPAAPRVDAPGSLVAVGAARLGDTRLIDNVEF